MDKITIERETLNAAMMALEYLLEASPVMTTKHRDAYSTAARLRAALAAQPAEAQQEPVAWAVYKGDECLRVHEKREWAEDWARAEAHFGSVGPYHIRELFAAPPAQPAEPQAQTVCKRTLIELDARLRECSIVGASAADAYDTFYQHMVETALAAQPAEPVQRLSDERAAFEAWHNEYRTQELVRRDDTYYNTHVRCRWEGWQARAIESALQPGWRDIESAPKDGTRIILGSSDGAWMAEYQPVYQSGYRPDNPWFSVMLNHAHMGRFPKAKPTHWQPIPPAPKATK